MNRTNARITGLLLCWFWILLPHLASAAGIITVEKARVSVIFDLYQNMSGLKLVIDSRVKAVNHLVTVKTDAVSRQAAAALCRDALLHQAGVVITPLDEKEASVTYNDALPISQPKT